MKREAATVPKGPRVATGFNSVLGVVDDVADVVLTVMTGIKGGKDIFGGKNNVLGNLASGKAGTAVKTGFENARTFDVNLPYGPGY